MVFPLSSLCKLLEKQQALSTPSIGKVRDADEWLCYGTYVAQRIVVKWIKSTQCITHGGLNIWLTDLGDSSAFVNHISVVAM